MAYADKRCGQRLESMAERFARWERRHAARPDGRPPAGGEAWDGATLMRVRARAQRLEMDVCRAADVRPEAVRRLRWTASAIRDAANPAPRR